VEAGMVLGMAARTLWAWRLELTLTLVVAAVFFQTTALPAGIVTLVLLTTTGVAYLSRRSVLRALHAADVKRQTVRAFRDCGLHDRCHKVTQTPVGDRLDVRIKRGHSVETLEQSASALAGCFGVADVRIARDPDHGGRATVHLISHDPFRNAPPTPWPQLHDPTPIDVWDKTRVGLTEHGDELKYELVGNNILIGGLIGGGKSVFLRTILATCALSTYPVRLHLFDGKFLELAPWRHVADDFVGRDGPKAVAVLENLIRIADQRQAEILDADADKISPHTKPTLPIHVLVIDELAEFTQLQEGKRIMELLRSIASRGRALGIVTVAATQYPHGKLIDTTLRGQFKTRVGFRVADRHQGGTIFGDSEPAQLAAQILDSTPGVAYAQDETGQYVRFRADAVLRPDRHHPDRADEVIQLVERAVAHRERMRFAVVQHEDPPTGEMGQSASKCKPQQKPAGRTNSKRATVMASIMENLSDTPVTRSELARLAGRKPTDGLVGLALGELAGNGQAVRNADGKWTEAT
jgi:DNA segregation ATPase FtsK/SpoIIIE, S-DNA-T family